MIDHVAQRLVTRVAELDDPLLLAASLRHGDGAGDAAFGSGHAIALGGAAMWVPPQNRV